MTRKEWKEEKDKWKAMNTKDRLWYLGAYYKVPILIILAAIFLLYQAAGAFFRSRQDCMLYCVFINQSYAGETNIDTLKDDFYAYEDFSGRQILTFDTSINMTDDLYGDASSILLQSLIGTDTVDVMISKEDVMEFYHDKNVYLDLRNVLSEDLLSQLGDELYYDINAEGEPVPVGIYLQGSALPSEYGLDEDSILSVCTLENHPDIINDFVRFAFSSSPLQALSYMAFA